MFRPISGHPQVHSWSLKHAEEEIRFSYHERFHIYNSILNKDDICDFKIKPPTFSVRMHIFSSTFKHTKKIINLL
jgi:hypothetical protein